MNFNVKNVDELYETIKNMYDDSNSIEIRFEQMITKIVNNLKKDWIGNDANKYINEIIQIYNSFNKMMNESNKTIHELSIPVVKMLSIKSININMVEKILNYNEYYYMKLEDNVSTEKLFIDNSKIINDYNEFSNTCSELDTYYKKITKEIDDINENWISGNNKNNYMMKLNDMKSSVFSVCNELNNVKSKFGVALKNIDELSK